MTTRICTLMWGDAWRRYGRRFVETFDRHWPSDVELFIVTDAPLPTDRARQIPTFDMKGFGEFVAEYGDDPRAQGMHSRDRKAEPGKRFWKHDAVKWAPQAFAPRAAVEGMSSGDVFCWLDADVETTRDVPREWIEMLLSGHDVACLQRHRQHSEIGFWACIVSVATIQMIDRFAGLYESGDVFGLDEWHSAYAFDNALASVPDVTINNLAPEGARGHVWPMTALGRYTVHKKGKLKGQ